uniref:Turripeptide OL172 n=1 Tax=Iotyrris olangoensis TaxID=2420066 RepID=TU172_IOTOL|nr:RecName: Full=Turripeptide OL172; Contains: RecName: Full=Turripeptide OL172 1; Contains: RecName: Full=Turripeptide OL172 2; Contains: RecName: Full=Turripeptide OL172 3; Contains: RecName: Full=Turripeptide OL172 conotoxin-like; Flags: Precursor [Iotyrris olangoensis]
MFSTLIFLTAVTLLMMPSQTVPAPLKDVNDIRVKGLLPLLRQRQLQIMPSQTIPALKDVNDIRVKGLLSLLRQRKQEIMPSQTIPALKDVNDIRVKGLLSLLRQRKQEECDDPDGLMCCTISEMPTC